MDSTLYVPIEELMQATGLSKIQVHKDIRAELLPGRIHRRTAIVLRSEWNAYLVGEWKPRRAVAGFVHRLSA